MAKKMTTHEGDEQGSSPPNCSPEGFPVETGSELVSAKRSAELLQLSKSTYDLLKADPKKINRILAMNLSGTGTGLIGIFKLPRIKIRSGDPGSFSLPSLEGKENLEEFTGILVFSKPIRAWWPDEYASGTPPSCKSDDGRVGYGCREVPGDPDSEYIEESPFKAHICRECKYSQFKSSPKGDGCWCKDMRAVFVLREEGFIPHLLILPPTSIKAYEDYLVLLGSFGHSHIDVTTRFYLEEKTNKAGQKFSACKFARHQTLSEIEANEIEARLGSLRDIFGSTTIESSDDIIDGGA